MENSLSQTILTIRDSLTEENWNRGSYFAFKNNNLCMCAHGAAQNVVNPKVKSILKHSFGNGATLAINVDYENGFNPLGDGVDANRVSELVSDDAIVVRHANTAALVANGSINTALFASEEAQKACYNTTNEVKSAAVAAGDAFRDVIRTPEAAGNAAASITIWNNRPDWIKQDGEKGSLNVHYLMGMVGLTAQFNDDRTTTLEMVKEKFTEAYELAKLIEKSK